MPTRRRACAPSRDNGWTDAGDEQDMGIGMPPNWGEVTEREAKIADADPGAVRAVESQLTKAAKSADDQSSDFKRLAGELREAWPKGSDADALTETGRASGRVRA